MPGAPEDGARMLAPVGGCGRVNVSWHVPEHSRRRS